MSDPKEYFPPDWYWIVEENDQLYSSSRANYVPKDDADFTKWQYDGGHVSYQDTAYNLGSALAPYFLRPTPEDVLEGYQAALGDDPTLKIAYDHEVRLCGLEGKEPPALGQFTAKYRKQK